MRNFKVSAMVPSRSLMLPVVAFLAVFYLLPGVIIALMSAGHSSFTPRIAALDFENYKRFFDSSYYVTVLFRTVMLGTIVGVLTAILAYPVAYYLVRSTSRFRTIIYFLTLIPMAVGMNMITLGWLIVLGRHGLINTALLSIGILSEPLSLMYTWGAMVVGLINVLFTFMVLPIAAVLRTVDPSIELAARNLGAGAVRTFALITLPLSLEGIAAGFLAVFMLSSGALVLPMMLGGQGNTILPVLIWEQFSVANDTNFASAIAMVLLIVSLLILLLQVQVTRARRVLT